MRKMRALKRFCSLDPVYAVRPHAVLAWGEFPQDATRWIFGSLGIPVVTPREPDF
jgi:hypothetical protein